MVLYTCKIFTILRSKYKNKKFSFKLQGNSFVFKQKTLTYTNTKKHPLYKSLFIKVHSFAVHKVFSHTHTRTHLRMEETIEYSCMDDNPKYNY